MTACAPALICAFKYKITESATLSNKRCKVCGSAYIIFLILLKVLLLPPSTIYVARVHGLPEKPISGTSPFSSRRIVRTAFITYWSSPSGSGIGKFSTALLFSIGRANFGPSPAPKLKPKPIASGIVKISENKIAASKA